MDLHCLPMLNLFLQLMNLWGLPYSRSQPSFLLARSGQLPRRRCRVEGPLQLTHVSTSRPVKPRPSPRPALPALCPTPRAHDPQIRILRKLFQLSQLSVGLYHCSALILSNFCDR